MQRITAAFNTLTTPQEQLRLFPRTKADVTQRDKIPLGQPPSKSPNWASNVPPTSCHRVQVNMQVCQKEGHHRAFFL